MSGEATAERLRDALVRIFSDETRDPAILEAFRSTPRELFAPAFFVEHMDGEWGRVAERTHGGLWLEYVYTDMVLVTQLNGLVHADHVPPGDYEGAPTCSSSQPSLMAKMIDDLGVRPGKRVFEAGTGTGYNAAILGSVVGFDNLVTVDFDPSLVESARPRLAEVWQGSTPVMVAGDANAGHPESAPFDAFMATCAMPSIPKAWPAQASPGATIIVPLTTGIPAGLMVRLTVTGDRIAVGNVQQGWVGFMGDRTRHDPEVLDLYYRAIASAGVERPTNLSYYQVRGYDGLWALAALIVRARCTTMYAEQGPVTWLLAEDGSSARIHESRDAAVVAEAGPRKLWAEVEQAALVWEKLGCPRRDRLTLTVLESGEHRVGCEGSRWSHPFSGPSYED